jgi:hypothetical protein
MLKVSRWKVLFDLVTDIGTDASGFARLKGRKGKDGVDRGSVEDSGDGIVGEKDVDGSRKEKKRRNFWRRLRELFRKRA